MSCTRIPPKTLNSLHNHLRPLPTLISGACNTHLSLWRASRTFSKNRRPNPKQQAAICSFSAVYFFFICSPKNGCLFICGVIIIVFLFFCFFMNSLTEKFNFKTTPRLQSAKLSNLYISILRLFNAVLSKLLRALFFFSMDDFFSLNDDDHLFALDYHPYTRKRPLSTYLDRDEFDETDDEETNRQKLYLVPYRCVFFLIFFFHLFTSSDWLLRKQEQERRKMRCGF